MTRIDSDNRRLPERIGVSGKDRAKNARASLLPEAWCAQVFGFGSDRVASVGAVESRQWADAELRHLASSDLTRTRVLRLWFEASSAASSPATHPPITRTSATHCSAMRVLLFESVSIQTGIAQSLGDRVCESGHSPGQDMQAIGSQMARKP